MIFPSLYIVFDIESTGLRPCYGDRITCICAKDAMGSRFQEAGEDEQALINKFLNWVTVRKAYTLISMNGKDFDVPFITIRGALLGADAADLAFMLSMEHMDLQDIEKISLNKYAHILLKKQKSGNGLDAIQYFREKNFDALKRYCMDDVLLAEEVFQTIQKLWEGRP